MALYANEMRLSTLEGTISSPNIIDKKKLIVKNDNDVPELMNWYETTFQNEVNRLKPDKIVCKLNLGPDKKQSITQIMPLGVFALSSWKMKIPFSLITLRQFSRSKLSLPKDKDIYIACDEQLGIHTPYWDKKQKDSIICAWMAL